MKRLFALAMTLLLALTALPAPAETEPLTRAQAAVLLDDLFALADLKTLNLPTYEATPRDLGYTASSAAILSANVIPAAKDAVQLAEHPQIETVINAGLMDLQEDGLSFRPLEGITQEAFLQALARGYIGPDLPVDHTAQALALGLFTQDQLTQEPMTLQQAEDMVQALAEQTDLVAIYATSDIHGNWLPYKSSDGNFVIGSAARVQTILEETRRQLGADRVVYVDGGDSPYNTTLANVTNGDVSVAVLNALGLAATALGNHDFDYSFENLLRLAGDADYAMLSANTRYKEGRQPAGADSPYPQELGDYITVQAGELTLGIFGITDDLSAATTLYANTENVAFDPDLDKAEQVVRQLKEEEGADLIIALSHLHSKNRALLEANPAIDVSIGGGNDIAGRPTILGENQYLINPGKHAEALTQINVVRYNGAVTGKVVNQLFLTEAYDEDAAVKALVEEYNQQVDAAMDQTVGYLKDDLAWSAELVRTQSSPIANLVADALLQFFTPDGAQLIIVNGGGIRAPLNAGEVTLRDITSVLPFDNNMMMVETSGQTIWDALENGISAWPATNGKFPQVAGITYGFKAGEPNALTYVQLADGTPLDPQTRYKVVINSFLAGGGDGYTMFNVLDENKEPATDVTQLVFVNKTFMRDALESYIQRHGTQESPLAVDLAESRIAIEE